MAFPAWAAAAIQGGTGIAAPIISGLMTQRANHDAMMYNQSMYWMQLEDERKNWNLQNQYNEGLWNKQNEYNERMWAKLNEYNSPMAQMKRFKEAGLNPNLIYGGQTQAPAIATAQQRSSSLSTPTPKAAIPNSWDFTPMANAIGNSLSTYMQMKESAARTNNLLP